MATRKQIKENIEKIFKTSESKDYLSLKKIESILESIRVELQEKISYNEFFKKKLEKYKVSSPTQLEKEKRKKFFDEVNSDWNKVKSGKSLTKKS